MSPLFPPFDAHASMREAEAVAADRYKSHRERLEAAFMAGFYDGIRFVSGAVAVTAVTGAAAAARAFAAKEIARNPIRRTFTSPDKHVAPTANRLEELFPGRVIETGPHLPANTRGGTMEVDILMDQFIIQVKKDRGSGLADQIKRNEAKLIGNTRRVIGYAPDDYSVHAWRAAAEEEIPIARNFEELVNIIKELSN